MTFPTFNPLLGDMQSESSSAPPPTVFVSTKKRRHFTTEILAILTEFANNKPESSLIERKHLLAHLQTFPGFEDYKLSHLNGWLKRRSQGLSDDKSVQTSNLTKKAIRHLEILYQGQPSPSPKVIETWAQLLHVSQGNIIAWIEAKAHGDTFNHNLPTPMSTSSPEPNPWSRQHRLAPVLTRRHIIEALAEVGSKQYGPTKLPTSAAEFDEMFGPYINMMEDIISQNEET